MEFESETKHGQNPSHNLSEPPA